MESDNTNNVPEEDADSDLFNTAISPRADDEQSETESDYKPLVPVKRSALVLADLEGMDEADFRDADESVEKSAQDVEAICKQIKSVPLFEGYDGDELLQLVTNYMYSRSVVKGEVVIKFGDAGDAFYVVRSGSFECTVPGGKDGKESVKLCSYSGSGCFGELALINRVPRAATITATSNGKLWVLCALRYSWHRKRQAMENAIRFEKVIKAIPMFRDNLDASQVNRLIDAIESVTVHAGEVICKQGETGDAMFFILEGEVEAMIGGKRVKLLQANEFFGERALILEDKRAATCVATTETKLAKLPQESFRLLIPDAVVDRMSAHIAASYGTKAPH